MAEIEEAFNNSQIPDYPKIRRLAQLKSYKLKAILTRWKQTNYGKLSYLQDYGDGDLSEDQDLISSYGSFEVY